MSLLALAAATLATAPASVVEIHAPSANEITIQAVAKLPVLGPHAQKVAQVLAMTVAKQTEEYIRRDMLVITNGQPVRTSLMPDHIRVSILVPPGNLRAGLGLLDAIGRRSLLSEESVQAAEGTLRARRRDPWSAALWAASEDLRPVTRAEVADLYRRTFTPGNLTVGVGGRFAVGDGTREWLARTADWVSPKLSPWYEPPARPSPVRSEGPLVVLKLAAPVIPARDPAFSSRFLAAIALGSGKGASMFRVAREQLGLSYRQESVLWPVPQGFLPMVVAATTTDKPAAAAEELRTALLEDVKEWTEVHRARALGMAESILLRSVDTSPLYLTPAGPPSDDLTGRTFTAAYWQAKTGEPFDPERLLAGMRATTLKDLKEIAFEMLAASKSQ